jgi:hypothetical protein
VALRNVPGDITSGPGWQWDPRGWVAVTGQGAVVDSIQTEGTVEVTANDVVIKNSRITVTGEASGVNLRHTTNVTIQDSEISSPVATGADRLLVGVKDVYGDASGTTILRNEISHTSTGVQTQEGLIEGNYIHTLGYQTGDHVNGITSNGGTDPLTIRHNTVLNQYAQTDAISLFQDFGPQANRLIENNLVAGGGYTIYAGANAGKTATATNISVLNNRVSNVYFSAGGSYGPVTAYVSGGGNQWSGNIWDASGSVIPTP